MKRYYSFVSLVLSTVVLAFWLLLLPRMAMAEPIPEYEMKAAYLYNFATFTTWPTNIKNPANNNAVRLCVFGIDNFDGALEKLTRNPNGAMRISLSYLASIKEMNACQIVFIDGSELKNAVEIMKQLENMPVLTVTDNRELFREGMMIGLFLDNKRLTFDVDYIQAQHANLTISSKLLRVARTVKQ